VSYLLGGKVLQIPVDLSLQVKVPPSTPVLVLNELTEALTILSPPAMKKAIAYAATAQGDDCMPGDIPEKPILS
jgi:SpoU rRNA methylase family enzyme